MGPLGVHTMHGRRLVPLVRPGRIRLGDRAEAQARFWADRGIAGWRRQNSPSQNRGWRSRPSFGIDLVAKSCPRRQAIARPAEGNLHPANCRWALQDCRSYNDCRNEYWLFLERMPGFGHELRFAHHHRSRRKGGIQMNIKANQAPMDLSRTQGGRRSLDRAGPTHRQQPHRKAERTTHRGPPLCLSARRSQP